MIKCWYKMFFRDKPNWRHETVPPCSPTLHCIWNEVDRQWSWTWCFWSQRKNDWLRFPSHRPKSCSANSGYISTFQIINLYLQFTICSSVSSDALLTPLFFFQLLRQSGKPWIYLQMEPRPGNEGHIFKFGVREENTSRLTNIFLKGEGRCGRRLGWVGSQVWVICPK